MITNINTGDIASVLLFVEHPGFSDRGSNVLVVLQ